MFWVFQKYKVFPGDNCKKKVISKLYLWYDFNVMCCSTQRLNDLREEPRSFPLCILIKKFEGTKIKYLNFIYLIIITNITKVYII